MEAGCEGFVPPDEGHLARAVEADEGGRELAAGGAQAVDEVVEVAGVVGQADEHLRVDLAEAADAVGQGERRRVEDGAVVRAEGAAAADRLVVQRLGRRAACRPAGVAEDAGGPVRELGEDLAVEVEGDELVSGKRVLEQLVAAVAVDEGDAGGMPAAALVEDGSMVRNPRDSRSGP